jgi:5-methylcytosine-specific restriction endonuclease McrA
MKNCHYCGVELTTAKGGKKAVLPNNYKTRDHKIPKSRGRLYLENNTVTCCDKCNREKGCLTYDEFRVVFAFRKQLVPIMNTKIFAGEVSDGQ